MVKAWGKIQSVAEYGGLSSRTIRKLLKEGLPYCKLPTGSIIIKFSDFDDFAKRFKVQDDEVSRIADDVFRELGELS